MSTWSIDSITKKQYTPPESIVRFIRYHPNEDTTNSDEEPPKDFKSPRARYLTISHNNETLECGQSYTIDNNAFKSKVTVEFNESTFIRNIDTEKALEEEYIRQRNLGSELTSIVKPEATPLADYDTVAQVWARLYVHNVGQGDTIVLELPDNNIWIIDAWFWGNKSYDNFKRWYSDNIDSNLHVNRVIVSHFHYDHIRSIPRIINDFNVNEVLIPNSLVHKTSTATLVLKTSGNKLRLVNNALNEIFGNLRVDIIPTSFLQISNSKDPNDHELAILLTTDNATSLLSGDISGQLILRLITHINAKKIQFYKVSHHGSYSGYNNAIFQNYQPQESIISCGKHNRYSHPSRRLIAHFTNKPTITSHDGKKVYHYCIY